MNGTQPRRRRRERPRTTSRAVTPAVVAAAVRALDLPTAAQVAEAVGMAGGLRVSGRAVRFLAEGAGILHEPDAQGVRRYWVGVGAGSAAAEVAVRDALRAQARVVRSGAVGPATLEADTRARLAALAQRHPELAGDAAVRAVVDRVNDVARLRGWPLIAA